MQLHFRKCTRNDLKTLLNISKTTFIDTFEKQINPDDFQNYIASAFNEDAFSSQLNNNNSNFYFAYVNHELAGYFKLNTSDAQTDVNDPDAVELERIYILKSFQGQKIGTRMLHKAIAIANELHARYLWLSVWENNKSAIRFYEYHNFEKFGEHPSIIHKDIPPDWLMKREL